MKHKIDLIETGAWAVILGCISCVCILEYFDIVNFLEFIGLT